MADITFQGRVAGAPEKLVDMGDGTWALAVSLVDAGGGVTLAGDVIVDTLGALDDAKVTNPDAASATVPALLRGILKGINDLIVLQTAANAKLDSIVTNTTPA